MKILYFLYTLLNKKSPNYFLYVVKLTNHNYVLYIVVHLAVLLTGGTLGFKRLEPLLTWVRFYTFFKSFMEFCKVIYPLYFSLQCCHHIKIELPYSVNFTCSPRHRMHQSGRIIGPLICNHVWEDLGPTLSLVLSSSVNSRQWVHTFPLIFGLNWPSLFWDWASQGCVFTPNFTFFRIYWRW